MLADAPVFFHVCVFDVGGVECTDEGRSRM